MATVLKLMAEYGGTVLWNAGEGTVGPVEPATLPITRDLVADICRWAEAYDRTLNSEYPPESGFKSAHEAEAFELEGLRLWQGLRDQLGGEYKVLYYSLRESRLLE